MVRIADACHGRRTPLQSQAQELKHNLSKVMRSFGRSCRGQGKVFVKLVRQTEQQLLEVGETISTLARQAQASVEQTTTLNETQRAWFNEHLATAIRHHEQIRQQSKQLTQGKKLAHFKVVNAYDPTIAPIIKGKSTGRS